MMKAFTSREQRIIWLCLPLVAMGLIHLVAAFGSLPAYIHRMSTLTLEPYQFSTIQAVSNEEALAAAQARGMSIQVYAAYQALFNGILCLFYAVLAGLLLWKGRPRFFAWFTATSLLMLSSYSLIDAYYQVHLLPVAFFEIGSLLWPLYLLFFFVFPNRHEEPAWARYPVGIGLFIMLLGLVVGNLTAYFPVLTASFQQSASIFNLLVTILMIFILVCQVYRYFFVSTPLERQQTKIFLAGLVFFIGSSFLVDLIPGFPYKGEANALELLGVPLAVAVSILRYRLWDIDLIIRRTLLYAVLSGLLGLVYYGSVILLRQVLGGFAGQSSAALVLSTLLIAALFNPLRRRLQELIDRSFYRKKYDAALALDGFSSAIRNEVEIRTLTSHLAQVVENTIQPQQISLWMKSAETTKLAARPEKQIH